MPVNRIEPCLGSVMATVVTALRQTNVAVLMVVACVLLACQVSEARADENPASGERLEAPATGTMTVGFLISRGADVIDFTGPWEVFQNVVVPGRGTTTRDTRPFELLTIGASREPIRVSGGLRVVPDFTFDDAPPLHVIVVPAQGTTPALLQWLTEASARADLTMSVCTGAFVLAAAGLLDGRAATTHHGSLNRMERLYPSIEVRRGVRYVEGPRMATAGGLTSGIDLALRVVERYFGRAVAAQTAAYMEHTSEGWKRGEGQWSEPLPQSAATARAKRVEARAALLGNDPVLLTEGREVRGRSDIWAEQGAFRYAFASNANRERFLADPERYAIQLEGACAFMAADGAPPGSGDEDRYLVHEGRIYIFASEGCRTSFRASPERYLPGSSGGK